MASPTKLAFAATRNAAGTLTTVTPAQDVTVTVGDPAIAWTASANQPWVKIVEAVGRFTVSISDPTHSLASAANATATITIATTLLGTSTTVPVALTLVQGGSPTTPPFGAFDTPADGATGVTGSIAVTGWALDDLGVASVKIYRNCLADRHPRRARTSTGKSVVFIGDASFLAGARPDVEALYPCIQLGNRAGWGYLLLTNMLPHVTRAGQSHAAVRARSRCYAYRDRVDGNRALLGQKSITLDNDNGTQAVWRHRHAGAGRRGLGRRTELRVGADAGDGDDSDQRLDDDGGGGWRGAGHG